MAEQRKIKRPKLGPDRFRVREAAELDDQTLDEELGHDVDVDHDPRADKLNIEGHPSRRDLTLIEQVDEQVDPHNVLSKQVNLTGVTLPQNGVFEHLSLPVQRRLLLVGRRVHFMAGASLNSVGDPCRGLGFILSGLVRVEWMDALGWRPIAQLRGGDVFGAMEWAEGNLWKERLTAEEDTLILFLPTVILNPLTATYPDLQRQVERYTERHSLHALLGSHHLFQSLPDEDMMHLIDRATMRYVTAGTTLYSPQMILALLFVVGRGEVELRLDDRVVKTLGRGEIANLELALGDIPHLLTATVISSATLYVLPFDEVEERIAHAGNLAVLQREAHLLRARALNE